MKNIDNIKLRCPHCLSFIKYKTTTKNNNKVLVYAKCTNIDCTRYING